MQNKLLHLVFFNTFFDVDSYLVQCKNTNKNSISDIIIAMSPNVRAYAKQRGISVKDTTSYFQNSAYPSLLKASHEWAHFFFKQSFILKEETAYQRSFTSYLRGILNYSLWVIEIVSNAIQQHNPDIVIAGEYSKGFSDNLSIESQEQYFLHFVQAICAQHQKSLYILKHDGVFLEREKKIKESYSLMSFIVKLLFVYISSFHFLLKRIFLKEKIIFYSTRAYGMEVCIKQFSKGTTSKFCLLSEPSILFSMDGLGAKVLWSLLGKKIKWDFCREKLVENEIKRISENALFFSYKGISISDVLCLKMKSNLIPFLKWLSIWERYMEVFLKRARPKALLTVGDRFDDLLLVDICKRHNIETILISHGSHVPPLLDEYAFMEWQAHGRSLLNAPFSTVVLQSPLSERFLKKFPSKSKIIQGGPLIWGRPIQLEKSQFFLKKYLSGKFDLTKTKIIVHASTFKPSQSFRPYVYETPDEYFQTLSELITAIMNIGSSVVLLIRFRSSRELSEEALKELLPFHENIILNTEGSFIDVLGAADLLISYSSTTIEEALQNRIPVLLYGGGGRYKHLESFEILDEKPLMKSPVYFLKEKSLLASSVRRILDLEIRPKEEALFTPYIYPIERRESIMMHL